MRDLDAVRSLAKAADFMAVMAVAGADGRVHASLVKAGVLEDPETGAPAVGVVVAGTTRKLSLLRLTGRASLTFTHGFQWVSVEGPAHLVGPADPPGAGVSVPATLRAVFVAAGGSHGDWEAFDQVMAAEHRCAVLLAPERILANRGA
jgi:hypothetical protein